MKGNLNKEDLPEIEGGGDFREEESFILPINLEEDRPFGLTWEEDEMISFLVKRGFTTATVIGEDGAEEVVYKPGDKIPEPDPFQIKDVFDKEVREIILKWLLKIGK